MGLMGHGARNGCSICDREFKVESDNQRDDDSSDSELTESDEDVQGQGSRRTKKRRFRRTVYGGIGFNTASWPKRNLRVHRERAHTWANMANPSRAKAQAVSTGVRWTVLLELPYFDPSRFHLLI